MKKILLLILAETGLAMLSRCTGDISGTGTLIGNPSVVVSGTIFYRGGLPAANVTVNIRKQNTLAFTSDSSTSELSHDTASVVSNNNGAFAFETSLNSGFYAIEAQCGNNSVLIDSIYIPEQQSAPLTLSPDTLRPAGAIKGVVKLAGIDDPSNVYVLAFGIDRFARVNSDGSFVFFPLAQGNYDLRIITSLGDYEVLDKNNISVVPSDTTGIGVLELPYKGIPVPQKVTVTYDTMKQLVTLHWDVSSAEIVKSYNIYRKENDSLETYLLPFNRHPIVSCLFIDSNVIQENHYAYRIATVDTHESEGMKSAEVKVQIVSAYKQVANPAFDGKVFNNINFVIDNQNSFWIADYHANKVLNYNYAGNLLTEWVISGMSSDQEHSVMAMDAQKNIYLRGAFGASIQIYDTTGNLIRILDDTTRYYHDISVESDGHLYCVGAKNISKFNPDGTFNKLWKTKSRGAMDGILVKRGKVYCAGADGASLTSDNILVDNGVIEVFDTSGTLLTTIPVKPTIFNRGMYINAFAIDNEGILYCSDAESGIIRLFNQNYEFMGQFRVTDQVAIEYVYEMAIPEDGTIIFQIQNYQNSTNSFRFYRKK